MSNSMRHVTKARSRVASFVDTPGRPREGAKRRPGSTTSSGESYPVLHERPWVRSLSPAASEVTPGNATLRHLGDYLATEGMEWGHRD
ncbi:hypothetical protein BHE74_00003058 [Ensete ventricosum]|nr:hypothetical protein GW17_00031556 [Ensete ventricosum]RWW88080.1 hypothetical protein BHE74_00003058 [Ensete ventricosum]RZR92867.1 hypothetical protein BHM03_00021233 [Ensete ventricosum]